MSQKPFVVVVEDDAALLRMTAKMLEPIAEVVGFGDGLEAFDYLTASSRTPQLLLTDVMMPRMDGLELVKQLRKDPRYAKMPVILLTAKSSPADVITGINVGARHYLTKPFKSDELVSKVKKTLRI